MKTWYEIRSKIWAGRYYLYCLFKKKLPKELRATLWAELSAVLAYELQEQESLLLEYKPLIRRETFTKPLMREAYWKIIFATVPPEKQWTEINVR